MLPQDPAMLLSFINTALRDTYPSLEELCAALDVEQDTIVKTLESIDYVYDSALNRFV